MKIKFFCPRWGSEQIDWNVFLHQVKAAGYDGVEVGIPAAYTDREISERCNQIEQHGLLVIIQHYDTNDADFSIHYDQYAAWLEKVCAFKVVKINSHTGKDFFTFEQNKALINLATAFSKEHNINITHETHRGNFSFAAHVTQKYLCSIPSLRLTLDISHWVNVAESYLHDQTDAVEKALSETEHIHIRIGYPQGPQVTDPRLPEWQESLNIHLAWWDRVVERKEKESKDTILTATPEFGPPPYMVTLPFTQQTIANQWNINIYMMELLKNRWGLWILILILSRTRFAMFN